MPAISRFLLAVATLVVAGCSTPAAQLYYPAETGWNLCEAALPIDMTAFAPGPGDGVVPADRWTGDQRAEIAEAIALAFARRCIETPELSTRAAGFDRIVALNSPDRTRVVMHPASRAIAVEIPVYADYRTDAFAADLRTGLTCFLAPDQVADRNDCPAG